ncbi:MAG: hypothetical protein WBK42_07710 [Dethiobacteria bacterium]
MKLGEITSFRKDLLFHGAVQLGWFVRNRSLSDKAAAHFIFHGPDYHGACVEDFVESGLQLIDTASFTQEIAERLMEDNPDDPFMLAIAGYGSGKSHLAITLATLFLRPKSEIAQQILGNLSLADEGIGRYVANLISSMSKPFLVVALNGMEDFDLAAEISRQILKTLKDQSIDTKILENLRPRFKLAENFAVSFYDSLREDFQKHFGPDFHIEDIIHGLGTQDEEVFQKINEIYKLKMGQAIPAVGQESLQDFIRVTKEFFCGKGKPFAGILIIFDEFGRYLEFAVQRPHVAGPAALQQLYESIQENGDKVFLLAFIQNELKAYISRVAPERREEINRYVTRYDAVRKVRLSTNLETVIANLLEKKKPRAIDDHIAGLEPPLDQIQNCMLEWFPDLKNHLLWQDPEKFTKVIGQGCWPLHPLSTWVLYKLTTIGKSLQQRSALSLIADVFETFQNKEFELGQTICPADLLIDSLIDEFSASEKNLMQGAVTFAYQSVLQKYQHELTALEKAVLKAIVLQQKIGIKVKDKDDYLHAISMFCNSAVAAIEPSIELLEKEYGVLEWNALLNQYEIVGDAVPRKTFLLHLARKVEEIDSERRASIFSANCKQWLGKDKLNTDFDTYTREWGYDIYFTDVNLLENQIQFALRAWRDAISVVDNKGQLIYCYVGPESSLELLQNRTNEMIKSQMNLLNLDYSKGAPLAILFLNDADGVLGQIIAEYWVLEHGFSKEERNKFNNFILDKQESVLHELELQLSELEKELHLIFATEVKPRQGSLKQMLEQLFEIVYPNKIPFPFDGFGTAGGKAAQDCQIFSRELLLGNLDREWLSAQSQKQKNRGYAVLDKSWGVFDEDGSVRLLPANPKIREALKVLDEKIQDENSLRESQDWSLGDVVRAWMAPPFGCNLASAGLLLAVYLGRRREELDLLENGEVVSMERWLARAIPKNFFDLSILDITQVIKISQEKVSEWESLLEEWELEPTFVGKVKYGEKANQLKNRIPVPQKLVYKYRLLQEKTSRAVAELNHLDSILNDALGKIEAGNSKDDVSLLSWGAAILAKEYNNMLQNKRYWTEEQLEEVKGYYAPARLKVKQIFPKWLNNQRVTNLEQLGKFKHHMRNNIGRNLEQIELDEEKAILEAHVEEVESNVHLLAEIFETLEASKKLRENYIVAGKTSVVELQGWSDQAKNLIEKFQAAKGKTSVAKDDIREAVTLLVQFRQQCQDQIQQYKIKAGEIYDHREITCLADITKWKADALELINVFSGQEKDIEDFRQIIKQLELLENHYSQLNNDNLTDKELTETLEQCERELNEIYLDDQPPLDSDMIYREIMNTIQEHRRQLASDWMAKMLIYSDEIAAANAQRLLEIKRQLTYMPAVLSEEQRNRINKMLEECDKRLDELEVDGLLAKFDAFSEKTKIAFLRKLSDYIEKHFPSFKLRVPFN